jgi:hypothetical protein
MDLRQKLVDTRPALTSRADLMKMGFEERNNHWVEQKESKQRSRR